jgi:hypothetical protein
MGHGTSRLAATGGFFRALRSLEFDIEKGLRWHSKLCETADFIRTRAFLENPHGAEEKPSYGG